MVGKCVFSNKWHTRLLSPWQASCPAMHEWSTLKGKWLINIAAVHYFFIFLGWPVMENKALRWLCCWLWRKAFHCFLIFSVQRRKCIPWGGFMRALLLCLDYTVIIPWTHHHFFVSPSASRHFSFSGGEIQSVCVMRLAGASYTTKKCIMVASENLCYIVLFNSVMCHTAPPPPKPF